MWAPVPARGHQAEKERGKGKATGTPEAAERGSPRECNRRAFPIYRGPVPGKGRPERSRDWSRSVGCSSLGGFWACGPRSPPEGPKQRRREGKERQRGRQKQQREEAQGSATDGLFLYIGAPFPARGARREAEIGAGALVVSSLGGFWACGPLSPPEGPKQRRREGKERQRGRQKQQREEAQGSATDGLFLYIGAPFPARGTRREAEIGAGGLVVAGLGGFWACGPRSPPEGRKQRRREGKERQRGRQKQQREEAQGSATDGLFLYIGAPFPARGARREAEIGAGGLVVGGLGGFWACGPRSPPEGPKQRRREGKERQRGRQKQHRGSPRECNRRAFPIYRGPVPGKGRPERSRDWSRSVGCL